MSRLDPLPLESLDEELQTEVRRLSESTGYVPNSFLIMGRRPEIAKNVLTLIRSVMRNPNSTIDIGLRWMVAHLCSRSFGCYYCSGHTAKNGARYGLPQDKFDALWEFQTSPLFSDAERAALRVAVGGGHAPPTVSDEDMEELKKHFSEEQVVEIVAVIALFGFNNRWNDIMKTDLEQTVEDFLQ
jgi:uncharacterized peroxidase-related enzyme